MRFDRKEEEEGRKPFEKSENYSWGRGRRSVGGDGGEMGLGDI